MAVENPTVGTRVSYEDVANQKRVGTVAGEGVGEWRVVWDDGDVTFSDLRQHGWKEDEGLAATDEQLAVFSDRLDERWLECVQADDRHGANILLLVARAVRNEQERRET